MSKFNIPSLAEIKAASKISGKSEPSLFKASTRTSPNQPQLTLSSSGAAQSAGASSSYSEPGSHSASATSAAVSKPEKTGKQVPYASLGNSSLDPLSRVTLSPSNGYSIKIKGSRSLQNLVAILKDLGNHC